MTGELLFEKKAAVEYELRLCARHKIRHAVPVARGRRYTEYAGS
jgi:hypothetical protein